MEGFIGLKPVGISHTNFNNDYHVKITKNKLVKMKEK